MEKDKLRIGIVLGSTREGRVSPQVGKWVLDFANQKGDAIYELVDIKDFNLPLLGESNDLSGVSKWQEKLAQLDAFVFIVQEYNHSLAASLKNALDSANDSWHNKSAGIVSYGSIGGARAAEHLKNILSELQIASVRTQVLLSLFTDFENGSVFKPQKLHDKNLNGLLDQVNLWGKALKTIRK